MRQRTTQTTTNAQMGLLDSLMIATPTNEFLERLAHTFDCQPVTQTLQAMYPATTERPPCAQLAFFKMSSLQHYYGLSNPQCEELVNDRLSWRPCSTYTKFWTSQLKHGGAAPKDKQPFITASVRV